MEIILASHNLHKIRELRAMLKELAFLDLLSLRDFPLYKSPEERGSSFQENATIKAHAAARALNKIALADDSGLVVPALGGEPGIHSARYAKDGATDKENRQKLLLKLQGQEGLARSAYFECCLTLAWPDGTEKIFRGICEGYIATQERGKNGFGYDPLFIKHDYNVTFAELDEQTKNRISHRRKAIEKLLLYLETLEYSKQTL